MLANRPSLKTARPRAILTIPELEHAKAAALGTLVSLHSRRAYKNAIDKFIAWYCSEPRLGFNRAVFILFSQTFGNAHRGFLTMGTGFTIIPIPSCF